MSKSYKKFPILRQERPNKKICKRSIRHKLKYEDTDVVLKCSQYKKFASNFRSYYSNNWKYPWFYGDAVKAWEENRFNEQKYCSSIEEYTDFYKRVCIRK